MAATFTVTGNLRDALGLPADAVLDRALIQSNLESGDALVDTTTNEIRLFPRNVPVQGGVVSFSLPATNATDLNVAANTLRYQLVVTYQVAGSQSMHTWRGGWWELTANSNLAALVGDSESSPMIVAWRDGFTAEMASVLGDAEAARTAAETARAFVEARVVDDLETTDGQTKALIETPSSETAQALSATIGAEVETPGTPAREAVDGIVTPAIAAGQRLGSLFLPLGDSISIGGDATAWRTWPFDGTLGDSWPSYASTHSGGKLLVTRNAGVVGNTSTQMLARFDTDVAPFAPAIVSIGAGVNDSSAGMADATYTANIKALVAKVRGIGASPVLVTITPVTGADTAQRTKIARWNDWLARYAAAEAIPLVDFHRLIISPTTGGLAAAYDSGDGVHPNGDARNAMGKLFWETVKPLITAHGEQLASWNTDPSNLLTNGLFITDAGADGIADGWTPTLNGATASLQTVTGIPGKAQRVVMTGATQAASFYQDVTTGFAVGDKMLAAIQLKAAPTVNARSLVRVDAYNAANALMGSVYKICDYPTDGALVLPFTVPSGGGNTTARLRYTFAVGIGSFGTVSGTFDFGRATLRNLSPIPL